MTENREGRRHRGRELREQEHWELAAEPVASLEKPTTNSESDPAVSTSSTTHVHHRHVLQQNLND